MSRAYPKLQLRYSDDPYKISELNLIKVLVTAHLIIRNSLNTNTLGYL